MRHWASGPGVEEEKARGFLLQDLSCRNPLLPRPRPRCAPPIHAKTPDLSRNETIGVGVRRAAAPAIFGMRAWRLAAFIGRRSNIFGFHYNRSGRVWPPRDFGFGPQTFQIVKLARLFVEDVQNGVAIIEHDPERCGHAFGFGAKTVFAHFVARVFGDRLDVRAGIARTQHEIIGENGLAAHVQNDDVERLEFVGGLAQQSGFAPGFGRLQIGDFDDWVIDFYNS